MRPAQYDTCPQLPGLPVPVHDTVTVRRELVATLASQDSNAGPTCCAAQQFTPSVQGLHLYEALEMHSQVATTVAARKLVQRCAAGCHKQLGRQDAGAPMRHAQQPEEAAALAVL